ncbi:hypothetical protein PG994_006982 [Apiospora phragmitis]|uniref:Ketosynthase family 3 (KS3) domain-containing protein n=1 Tax=Apiospora phragmitis TaxID=2905665 RepID=A0ABR1UZI3_9PEZI
MLEDSRCAASKYPADRFNVEAFWNPDSKKLNFVNSQEAHFLGSDIKNFDAGLFSVPPNEASSMDPQQRSMMETAFHVLESAANRICWFYDVRGESTYLDTACSTSLPDMHLACQGLAAGNPDVAVVGGSNVILNPEVSCYKFRAHTRIVRRRCPRQRVACHKETEPHAFECMKASQRRWQNMTSPNCLESGLVWSSLRGWWLSSESFRQDGPIVSEARWDTLLKESISMGTDLVFRQLPSLECYGVHSHDASRAKWEFGPPS